MTRWNEALQDNDYPRRNIEIVIEEFKAGRLSINEAARRLDGLGMVNSLRMLQVIETQVKR